MRALYRYREVLNPLRHGTYALQMLSHKVMRYVVPALLVAAFLSNAALAGGSALYRLAFVGQAVFYVAALVGWRMERAGLRLGPLAFPYYFALGNAASISAALACLRGERQVVWEPIRGAGLAASSPDEEASERITP
jgi:hypothetical protein